MIKMNWNLKRNSVLMLLFLVYSNSYAQKNTISKLNFYATIGPVFNGSMNSSTSNNLANGTQTYAKYQDSIGGNETWRLTYSPQIGIIYQLSKNVDLQCGLGYMVLGHQRQLNNLHYKDATFPGIGSGTGNGVLIENTNVERNIDLNYRYQYLQIPVLFNYHLNIRNLTQKVKISLCGGLGLNLLLKHDINAVLGTGFKIDNKSSFSLDSTGYKANVLNANLMIGSLVDYNYTKQIKLIFQPLIGYFPMSVTSGEISANPWFVSLNLGIIYTLDKLKK